MPMRKTAVRTKGNRNFRIASAGKIVSRSASALIPITGKVTAVKGAAVSVTARSLSYNKKMNTSKEKTEKLKSLQARVKKLLCQNDNPLTEEEKKAFFDELSGEL